MVVALGTRAGSNPSLKPRTALNEGVATSSASSQPPDSVVRIAFRAVRMRDGCELESRDVSNLDSTGITVSSLMLLRPLFYVPTGRDQPERHEPSYARGIFTCKEDVEKAKNKCTEVVQKMVDHYSEQETAAVSSEVGCVKKARISRYQMKTAATCLQHLVRQIFDEAVKTRNEPASSAAYIPGDARLGVRVNSPQDIVNAPWGLKFEDHAHEDWGWI